MPPAADPPPVPGRMPALFVGHGSPMNAIEDNRWSRALRQLAAALPRPRAILAISAHWWVPGTRVTAGPRPATIHDYSGFPDELMQVRYPAPGEPALAAQVTDLLAEHGVAPSDDWGLDHGTWQVLRHLFPAADVPVVQLSMDQDLDAAGHHALGRLLAPLRDQGVLILGSGNITHNLRAAMEATRRGDESTPAWAADFDTGVAAALLHGDAEALVAAPDTDLGRLAHPVPDHYLPLLYAAGAAGPADPVSFPITGFALGSLSMRSVRFG